MNFLQGLAAFAFPQQYSALTNAMDQSQAQSDLAKFQADPTYRLNPSAYTDPATGIAVDTHMKGLRDFRLQEQASPILEKFSTDYANVAGPDKRFFADPASREVLQQSGLTVPDATGNPYIRKGLQDFRQQGQLENDMGDLFANPNDVNALARVASNPLAQSQHNILNTLQTSQDKALVRADAQAKEEQKLEKDQNVSDFQGAIAGLTGQSKSPYDLKQFGKTGGYSPFPSVESDIRQAAAAYGVGDSDEVNKAITEAREAYKNTYLPQETVAVGRTTATGQKNLLGDFRKDASSTAPVVKVSVNQAGPSTIDSMAQAVLSGQMAPKAVPRRNGTYEKVVAAVRAANPNFDFVKADANATYAQTPGNLNSRALIQGVEPLYSKLLEAGQALGNSSIPGANRVKNWVKEQTGNADIVAFNNLRDDVIAESERVLLGSGVLSDAKYLRAVKNVSSAASMPQLKAAVAQLRLTVKSRLEALDKQPYPAQSQAKPAVTSNLQSAVAAELARRKGRR